MIGSTTRLLVLMEELREIGPTTPDHKEEKSISSGLGIILSPDNNETKGTTRSGLINV